METPSLCDKREGEHAGTRLETLYKNKHCCPGKEAKKIFCKILEKEGFSEEIKKSKSKRPLRRQSNLNDYKAHGTVI